VSFLFWLPALIIALAVHEYSHARVADELGDPTPRAAGRLTLNPLAHIDPIGTIALLLFHFGWGKPVPIDPYNLRNPRRDQALIALAGPLSNFLVAIAFSLAYFLSGKFLPLSSEPILYVIFSTIVVMNLGLGLFNLIPVGPLDGTKIVGGLLSSQAAAEWEETTSRFGIIILLLLFLPLPGSGGRSLLDLTFSPILRFLFGLLFPASPGVV